VLKRDDPMFSLVSTVFAPYAEPRRPPVKCPPSQARVSNGRASSTLRGQSKAITSSQSGSWGRFAYLSKARLRIVDDNDVRALVPRLTQPSQASVESGIVRSPDIVRIELEYSILHEKVVRGANHAVYGHFSSVLDNRLRQRRLARSRKSSHHNEHPWDITQVRPPSLVANTHEWVDDPAGDVVVVLHVWPGTNELREVRKVSW
jgi:hypothetical protein